MIDRRLDVTAPAPPSRSVTDLLQDTATHTENVVRGEIRLAVVRAQDQLSSQARRASFVIIGGALGLVASTVLLVAAIMRLSLLMAPWLATTIVGALVAVVAVVLVMLPSRANGAAS